MSIFSTLQIALRALMRNKLRSFLTALGIIVGTGAVIAMAAIGEGAKARVEQAFASMGANLLVITSGTAGTSGVRSGAGTQPTLTWDDLRAIQSELNSIWLAAPVLRHPAPLQSDGQNWTAPVFGTTSEYFEIRTWGMASGISLSQSDVNAAAKVAVLGQTVVEKLFGPHADPVGQSVRIRNIPFQVIGVMERKGQSPAGADYDDAVFIPYTTYLAKIAPGPGKFIGGQIFAGADPAIGTERAEKDLIALLRERHRAVPAGADDFSVRNLAEMASSQQEGVQTLSTLLACIAAVSLLVGGIGVMNIMLVSVTERTREIGIRMAVGARSSDILAQFLVEALSLTLLGGLSGVFLGVLAAHQIAARFDWSVLVRGDIVAVALVVSAGVGVVFGLYPARKAAQFDPIEALRYE
ncbi:MAG: ABC transporter permease [Gammaproteobacteria bacterium]|nr:ABC transporter permease [Gammaproteobacteria bacterium]